MRDIERHKKYFDENYGYLCPQGKELSLIREDFDNNQSWFNFGDNGWPRWFHYEVKKGIGGKIFSEFHIEGKIGARVHTDFKDSLREFCEGNNETIEINDHPCRIIFDGTWQRGRGVRVYVDTGRDSTSENLFKAMKWLVDLTYTKIDNYIKTGKLDSHNPQEQLTKVTNDPAVAISWHR